MAKLGLLYFLARMTNSLGDAHAMKISSISGYLMLLLPDNQIGGHLS